jgi:hypothetical protein
MWFWRIVTNPASGDVVGSFQGSGSFTFSLMGICISHNSTSAIRVRFRTKHATSEEIADFFTITVPPNSTFVLNSPEDTLISEIGAGADEFLEVVVLTGGTYELTIGLNIRGVFGGGAGFKG